MKPSHLGDMGILVEKNHPLYCFAYATEMQEKHEILRHTMEQNKEILNAMRAVTPPEHKEYFDSIAFDSAVYDELYRNNGVNGTVLECVLKVLSSRDDLLFKQVISNPIPNSKHPVDVVVGLEDGSSLKKELREFQESLNGRLSNNKKKALLNEWFNQKCQLPHVKINVKGIEMEERKKGSNKGSLVADITLSRNTKGQEEKEFCIRRACHEKINVEFGENGTVSHVVVWLRMPIKDRWRYMVVAFPSSAFVCDPEKFVLKGKQYKNENNTPHSDLIINAGASYQLVCRCRNLRGMIDYTGAEILYNSCN